MISEDIHVELLELLELYCELLLARFGVLDQNTREPDPAVSEGVCSIIYAAPRTELRELHILRDILMHKYGRDFSVAVMENRDGCVTDRVVRKLIVATPSAQLVDGYLAEITKAYGVPWTPPSYGGDGDGEGGVKEIAAQSVDVPDVKVEAASPAPKLPDIPPTEDIESEKSELTKDGSSAKTSVSVSKSELPEDDFDLLTKRFAALKKR